jgi:hypothetical protein
LVNYINNNWENKDILIGNILTILIMNAFLSPTMKLIDFGYRFKLWKRRNLKKQLGTINKDEICVTQREANELFEGPKFNLDIYFAGLGKTSLLTFFFLPIFPFAVVISGLGLVYTYWVDKVILYLNSSISLSQDLRNQSKLVQK